VDEREGGDGRDPTTRNMVKLIPAVKSRCWRQNLNEEAFDEHARTLLIVVPRPVGTQTVACGEATLPQPLSQQEKNTRQMSAKKSSFIGTEAMCPSEKITFEELETRSRMYKSSAWIGVASTPRSRYLIGVCRYIYRQNR